MDAYHRKYANQSDKEINNRLKEKKNEITEILGNVTFQSEDPLIKLAVLGCGDKRFIKGHKRIFEEVFNKTVEVTTFDITTQHLQGEGKVIEHDCTQPLPVTPYTITYAHVLLKFIEISKQWDLIINSYEALGAGGMAIHILDKADYESKDNKQQEGYFTVPLQRWIEKLDEHKIQHKEVPVQYGIALVLLK